jgi:PIN domain nuclease of toxin-antitoxin system
LFRQFLLKLGRIWEIVMKQKNVGLKVEPDVHRWIRQLTVDFDCSIKELVMLALDEYVSKHKPERNRGYYG